MKKTILMTGGSGFLGSRVARLLLSETDCDVVLIVRGSSQEEAERRIRRLWADWPDAACELGRRVRVLRGDLCEPRLGLSAEAYRGLVDSLTHIIHAAAELDLDGPLEELRRTNVGGTARLLELATAANRDHGLHRFSHVSTAYVAGRRTGEVGEEELTDRFGFSNSYEQTKYEGERLVRTAMGSFPVSVFRPGMVVGDSETGEIQTFNTVYVPLRLYLSGKLRLIPSKPTMKLNLVPVDYVARAITRLTFHPEAIGRTFHLTVDTLRLPTAREVLDSARDWAREGLGEELPTARFVPFERVAGLIEKKILSIPACLVSYFNEERRYMRENLDRLMGSYEPDWTVILPRLLEYAARRGFLRRTGRTAHEQVVVRLESKRLPLRVHDIDAEGRDCPRSGREMCDEIDAVKRSLAALGVRPTDRVALVGHNSSRYLSLDVAVGLVGAVSVPLYYTAPPAEIAEAVRLTGARHLFVGAAELVGPVSLLSRRVRLVSFCRGPVAQAAAAGGNGSNGETTAATDGAVRGGRATAERPILSWEAFLALGGASAPADDELLGARPRVSDGLQSPVDLDDVATIRFTSGTTGEPKGVTFRHAQLTWLAETVISILPWRATKSAGRYLSFLPMNHVVEGILGTYAPAYMPAPVDIYFLKDIHALPAALRAVRPTVFFSVPRFYEKIRERFDESPAGTLYRSLRFEGGKRIVRPLCRHALLHRAGLDACMQLIVGSAPCSQRLLEDFRELGVELHNAYGLTEAPLITLNRYRRNRIASVGSPLPETELRVGPDGEILVHGPQVTAGIWPDPIQADHGWLATGDLGSIDADGNLMVEGRKRDILVTSYGKNIRASKIEAMLRDIPGVLEAVVLGESLPAVCGLLWLKSPAPTPEELASIDRAVETLNGDLSHPERLKRWAILSERPSIENTELTGNLKLKRAILTSRRAGVVSLLYEDMAGERPTAPGTHEGLGVLHLGRGVRRCA